MRFLYDFLNDNVFGRLHAKQNRLLSEAHGTKFLLGQLLSKAFKMLGVMENIHDAEFKVFSQWGDDGIIQYLVDVLNLKTKSFIEFGVSNYVESNTRFLLLNNNWSGLVLDCSEANVRYIKNDEIYWRHDLKARFAFVTAENVNKVFVEEGFEGDLGLLHIDIDGNDYWVWKAIDVVSPIIVIIEYNSLLGCDRAITIPYDPQFSRFSAHHSGIYAGCSLLALCDLAEDKGYCFVGSNSAGNNAYFIRKDKIGGLRPLDVSKGYVAAKFREHRDLGGVLSYMAGTEALETIRGLPVYNTRTQQVEDL